MGQKYKTTIDIKRDGKWLPPGSLIEFDSEQEVIDRLKDKSIRPYSQEQHDEDEAKAKDKSGAGDSDSGVNPNLSPLADVVSDASPVGQEPAPSTKVSPSAKPGPVK